MVALGQQLPAPINAALTGLLIFLSTLFGCVVTQLPGFVFIRPFSRRLWKQWNAVASDTWFRFIIFIMEYWNGLELRISGEHIPDSENALIISNHPSEADWFFSWSLGWRKRSLGNVKICMKDAFMKLPGLGWSIDNLDYPFMSRKWEFDEALIKHFCKSFVEDRFRLWLTIFSEGTDFSEAKQRKSWEIADQSGLPKYKHLLLPRTKGSVCAIQSLRTYVDCIYDFTLAYPNKEKPTFYTGLAGRCPSQINVHIKRIPIKDVPHTEDEIKAWIFEQFKQKDDLLEYFDKNGKFPGAAVIAPPGPGLSPKIAFAAWTLMVILSLYGIATSSTVRWCFLIGWATFVPFAHSRALRRWRGLDPPLNATTKKRQ